MKKNIIKIILDMIMFLLLFLMYSKNAVSMSFHEIGGLVVCGLFFIHVMLNKKWVAAVTKRLFDKSLPAKTRLGYIVNVMLFVCMAFIAVSGIMISKTLFTGLSGGGGAFYKLGHFFAAAIAIILVGIHIGLHWSFIKNMFGKMLKIPPVVAKPLGIICLVALLIFGGYNTATTDFARWVTAPFTISSVQTKGGERPEGMTQEGSENTQGMPQAGKEGRAKPEGMPEGGPDSSFSFSRAFNVFASYGSIAAFFAAITVFIENLRIKKRL